MLLSRNTSVAKAALLLITLGLPVLLSSCQVRPLYGSMSQDTLQTIGISAPKSRLEQKVRNELVFMLSGGAGEPVHPSYNLKLNVSSSSQSYLVQRSTTAPKPGHVKVTGTYILSKDGQVVAKGTRSSEALLDYPSQQFAVIRAVRDAEDRAATDVAEQIRTDISVALEK
jgi:LPS-assembly lipoprotein